MIRVSQDKEYILQDPQVILLEKCSRRGGICVSWYIRKELQKNSAGKAKAHTAKNKVSAHQSSYPKFQEVDIRQSNVCNISCNVLDRPDYTVHHQLKPIGFQSQQSCGKIVHIGS